MINWGMHIIIIVCKFVKILHYEDAIVSNNTMSYHDLLVEVGVNMLLFYVLSTMSKSISVNSILIYIMDSFVTILFVILYGISVDTKHNEGVLEAYKEQIQSEKEANTYNLTPKPLLQNIKHPKVWALRCIVMLPYYLLFTDT